MLNINLLKRDIRLLIQSPRDYLYSFTYSVDKKIKIKPYNPAAAQLAKRLIRSLRKKYPHLTIYLYGSVDLGISQGEGDIDLIAETPSVNFEKYFIGFSALFGQPDKVKAEFIEWRTEWKGYHLEFSLVDPGSYMSKEPVGVYKLLKRNKKLLKEYDLLKKQSDGVSVREYARRKIDFFNRLKRVNKFIG